MILTAVLGGAQVQAIQLSRSNFGCGWLPDVRLTFLFQSLQAINIVLGAEDDKHRTVYCNENDKGGRDDI